MARVPLQASSAGGRWHTHLHCNGDKQPVPLPGLTTLCCVVVLALGLLPRFQCMSALLQKAPQQSPVPQGG